MSSNQLAKPDINNFGVFRDKKNNMYAIPNYQRSYSWGKHKADDYWDELLIPDNKSDYKLAFTGSVILKHNPKKDERLHFELIDGQQRFITTSILIAVMRDYARFKLNEKYKKNKNLKRDFESLINNEIKPMLVIEAYKKEPKSRINVGMIIRDLYDKVIANEEGYDKVKSITLTSLKNESERNIIRNYKAFWVKLDDYVTSRIGLPGPGKNKLENDIIFDLLQELNNIEFIEITVLDDVVAYEIFETVNSKNEPLTSSDLIKNLILMNLKGDGLIKIQQYEDIWNQSLENIDGIKGINFNQFIRYHWLSKYGWSTDKKLYANFKSYLNSLKDNAARKIFLRGFLKELKDSSYYFKVLFNPGHDGFIDKHFTSNDRANLKIAKSLKSLKSFNVKQCYVLLLSLIRNAFSLKGKLKDKSKSGNIAIGFSKILRQIEIFSLKFSVLGKGQANLVERDIYHSLAVFIEHNLIKPSYSDEKIIKSFNNQLSQKITHDLLKVIEKEDIAHYDNFERSILRFNYNDDYDFIVYILEKINQQKYNQKEFSFNEDFTLEHILPRQPKKWGLKEKEIESYINKLGNLIVIGKQLNQDLGNETLFKKLNGIHIKKRNETISLFDSKCEHNIMLFEEMKKNIPSSDPKNLWSKKFWNEEAINNRQKKLAKEFYDSLDKYLK